MDMEPSATATASADAAHGGDDPPAPSSAAAAASACEALRDFCAHSCLPSDRSPGGGCDARALRISIAPPPASDTFAHECALGFMFADEMKVVRQLQHKRREGALLVQDVYCARGCARAIPPMTQDADADAATTTKYYMAVFTVLQPQVEKIMALSDYCSQTVVILSDNIQRITVHENTTRVIPDVLLDALLDVMDVVLQLNQLHDTKSSLRNDFSVFKRAFTHVQGQLQDAEQIERDIHRLQDFIGNSSQSKGSIWDSLRHNLTNVKRFDQVVYLLLKHCLSHIEDDICLVPEQKFKFVRVLPSLLFVLEESRQSTKASGNRAAEKKAMEAAAKVLQRCPVVPMFAEINAMPVSAFQSPNVAKSEFGAGESVKSLDQMFDLPAVSAQMRGICEEILPRLVHAINMAAKGAPTSEENGALYSLILETLVHVNDWKSSLLLFVASKYQYPRSNDALQQMAACFESPYLEYERMTKYNFTKGELSAMVDVVHCVKSVVQILRANDVCIVSCIQRHIYQRTQKLVQHTVLPILHRAHKRKLVCAKVLHDVRMTCGDWADAKATSEDFLKKRKERRFPDIGDTTAAPTICQIQMLRTLVNAVYAKRSMGDLNSKQSSLFSFKKDLDSSDIDLLQQFYREAGAFSRLLDLEDTLCDLGDFSSLWFRELYLEITKCPQFPTDTSVPWLLVEHCLQRSSVLGLKPVMAIVDIYNDAANCCLYKLKRQTLFDEAEAEGKLCFDQLVYILADQLYVHCKSEALQRTELSVSVEDAPRVGFRGLKKSRSRRQNTPAAHPNYEWVADAKRIEVFGESHNLTLLLGQHAHLKIMKDLEKWLSKLEASDVTSMLESWNALQVLRASHALLSNLVPMDKFDDMIQDIDAQSSVLTSEGEELATATRGSRIQDYASQILLLDLFQHFGYCAFSCCFRRVPLPSELLSCIPSHFCEAEANERASFLSRVASSAAPQPCRRSEVADSSYLDLLGSKQAKVFLDLLPTAQMLDVVDDCRAFIEAKIEDVLQLCIPALGTAIPPFRFPRFMYRTEGCFGFFEGKFKHLLDCEELEAHVFHCFREVGNGLCFLLLLSDAMDERASSLVPTTQHVPQGGVFRCVLQQLHRMLHATGIANEWHAARSSHPGSMPSSSSFYHVWSALEFLSCTARNGVSIREQFGDGVQFAGCTIVHLLNQRSLYELWNVSQHVLNVHFQEQTKMQHPATTKGKLLGGSKKVAAGAHSRGGIAQSVGSLGHEMKEKAAAFAANAVDMRKVSDKIFHVLETTWPSSCFPHSPSSEPSMPLRPPAFEPPSTRNGLLRHQQKSNKRSMEKEQEVDNDERVNRQ